MRFHKQIEAHREALIASLQDCVRIESVYAQDESGYPYGEKVHDCLHYMLNLAGKMGFSVYNMDEQLGWCEYGDGEEMVAVLGHLDVVPAGEGWTVEPYGGAVQGGRIYGRGTMDDKGPTVAALFALHAIRESGLPLKRRIRLLFGLNEETGSADMKYYAAHGGETPVMGFTPDGEYPVINGEKGLINETYACRYSQSGPLRLKAIRGGTAHNIVPDHARADFACAPALAQEIAQLQAQKAVVSVTADGFFVETFGVNAHGGTPHEGENAVGRLMQFLDELPLEGGLADAVHMLAGKIGMEWDGASMGVALHDDVSGPLTLNLGTVSGDENGFEVRLNYRYPVTFSYEDCGVRVKETFEAAGFERTAQNHKKGIYMAPDSELVQRLMRVYRECTGDDAQPKAIGGGTYAKMMPNVLAFGPIFPGDEVREHKPDEFMEISRLMDNANILAEAMYALAAE